MAKSITPPHQAVKSGSGHGFTKSVFLLDAFSPLEIGHIFLKKRYLSRFRRYPSIALPPCVILNLVVNRVR